MKRTINKFLLLISFLLLHCAISKAEGYSFDSIQSKERGFNAKSIHAYKAKEEFNYQEVAPESNNSFIDAILRFLASLFELNSKGGAIFFWKYVLYALIIVFIIFLILKIAGASKSWFIHSKNKKSTSIELGTEESISGIDFNHIISKAIDNKEYRKAIRYFYLYSLQILTDKGLIEWKPEKTNNDYIKELKSGSLKSTFRDNTLIYEYIYYGDFKINESSFHQAKISFEEFISSLKKLK